MAHFNKNFSLIKRNISMFYSKSWYSSNCVILGIETSCDDTGCAIVDSQCNILGESLNSQQLIHLQNGGIIPPIAENLHRKNIENVVNNALASSKVHFADIDAVATTVTPGLPLSLKIGVKYGKYLCKKYNKPFIPIHHMEAHALTARMCKKDVNFPFLVLLISGGHCLIAVCKDVNKFLLLGESIDDSPGEAFDKVARRLKMKNIPEFSTISGGQAIELAASRADNPIQFKFSIPLLQYKDCNFSFSGLKTQAKIHIQRQEKQHNLPPDGIIPDLYNLCAGFQLVITRHLCHRVQRAMEFAEMKGLLPRDNKTLVISGGVACNNFIAKGLQIICKELEYKMVRPPPKLCTDNGVMIAWNGVERWRTKAGVTKDLDSVDWQKSCPLGENLINEVKKAEISPHWVRISKLTKPQVVDNENNISLKLKAISANE
ncbi:probable tRNA N6-adenosine threonylcarbamoyltransferase, mitochondrial [Agrilus planipennis]|uniref:N(6)-L-threonylcarbamoyladenine synthase n=1 Tax=Agrilus planipennis TaxID=224129 RepID=A0A1W4WPA9_AGRPL|nr:probable tRNA N6-adenosine threonylcarbamoyltransferase, mitochondrial [Agrilus planipennis]